MKFRLLIILAIQSYLSFGQNYKLFNSSSKKLFIDLLNQENTYSLAFDSAKTIGADSVYYNFYYLTGVDIIPTQCASWGSCTMQNLPSWAGRYIIYNNNLTYQFLNLAFDTLMFDFNKSLGDTSVFYRDASQIFSFVYERIDSLTVLNNPDSAKFYRILHTDLSGTTINSALNQQQIIVSKNWGLTRFFSVDSFPQVLKPLDLIGNISPTGGLYQLQNEQIYDHQVGDEIQKHFLHLGNGRIEFYAKYTYLSKTTTVDSLFYQVQLNDYNVDSAIVTIDTISLKYGRFNIVAQIPFELFNGTTKWLSLREYCGMKLWTYTELPRFLGYYCPADTCWPGIDRGGLSDYVYNSYVTGLGLYTEIYNESYFSSSFYNTREIIYFKKNGISCGSQFIVGMNELEENYHIQIFPNPFRDELNINIGNNKISEIVLFDILSGKKIDKYFKSGINIDTGKLTAGIYIYEVINDGNIIKHGKIIKELE